MIIESIILIIFVCSLGGALIISARKIPVLKSLPENGETGIGKHKVILKIENKIKEISVFFEKQIFLHKFLSFIKVITLRVETKIDVLLHKIRSKNKQISKEKKDK